MKKLLAIMMAVLMTAMLFTGCAATPAETQQSGGESSPTAEQPRTDTAEPATGGASELEVVVVVTDALGGGGTPDDMNNYLKKAIEDFGVNGTIYEATDAAQYEEVLRTFARENVDLIVTAFPQMVEAVSTVAAEFPEVNFAILLPLTTIDLPNVRCVEFACW